MHLFRFAPLLRYTVALTVPTCKCEKSCFWTPPIFVPVMGMLLGNAMGSVSVATTASIEAVELQQHIIETRLSFGASGSEAIRHVAVKVAHTAILPTLTQLSVMGIINIPGMMTGQIIAGTPIHDAVIVQICIMFMATASSVFSVLLVIRTCMRILMDSHHRIRADRISKSEMSLMQLGKSAICCCIRG
ncbi:hypothetical protein BX666DRAFT_141708 [Dichotomocladium elegans]|nr:hypothetical protein BX666DRAFT_141708 [Dichotomocladium elegans]